MNYLAHAVLSFSDEQIAGQFLEDFIPNRHRFSYPPKIVEGIILHREIDTYTDAHPVIREAKKCFSPLVRLYSGAFVDVAMDYFLANTFTDEGLQSFTQNIYSLLKSYSKLFPEPLSRMSEAMASGNWLYHYREDWSMEKAMQNVLNRAKYLPKDLPVYEVFLQNKEVLKKCFDDFYPDLYRHAVSVNERFQNNL